MSLWESLGFRKNPYEARWLEVSEDGYSLFVGRKKESRNFQTNISSSSGGLIMVEGDVGVGKTSFVNIQEYISFKKKIKNLPVLLPCFETTSLYTPLNPFDILLSILSNCLYSLMRVYGEKKILEDKRLKRIYSLVNQTVEILPAMNIGGTVPPGFGITLGGGKSGFQTSPAGFSIHTLAITLDNLVKIVKKKYKFDGISVPLNNLDIIDEHELLVIFNQLRDILVNRKYFWWIFIGPKGLFTLLETKRSRISEIFTGRPIVLPPLSFNEIKEAIDRRIKTFRISKNVRKPVPDEVVKVLYDTSKGEIRFIFKRLTDLLVEFKTRYPSAKFVNYKEATYTLKQIIALRLNEINLTEKEQKILEDMAEMDEFRPKDYKLFGLKSAQSLTKYIKRFLSLQLLYRTREGKAAIYRCCGDVKLFFSVR